MRAISQGFSMKTRPFLPVAPSAAEATKTNGFKKGKSRNCNKLTGMKKSRREVNFHDETAVATANCNFIPRTNPLLDEPSCKPTGPTAKLAVRQQPFLINNCQSISMVCCSKLQKLPGIAESSSCLRHCPWFVNLPLDEFLHVSSNLSSEM
jgi:hypothetical protein